MVVLKVNQLNDWASRVLVNDLLPAGFEIDNPRLVSSADLTNFPWLVADRGGASRVPRRPFHRGVQPGSERRRARITLAYVVRAVTPGTYAHPAASVEDMYRPEFSARTASGAMEVKAP